MASKYNDLSAVVQVIGSIYKKPSILDNADKYVITDEDFGSQFHKIVFGSIYKLHELGAKQIDVVNIIDFLSTRPEFEAVYNSNKGSEWLAKAADLADPNAFNYYYNRLKKMSLLRAYDTYGVDISFLYDPDNILDVKKKQAQEEWLDSVTLEDIAQKVNDMLDEIRTRYVDDTWGEASQAGDGIEDLIESLKSSPEIGVPLYGSLINAVTRGARLKKFYLRSAPTGTGKSRTLIADACNIACNRIYDDTFGMWVNNGTSEPTLFIATEQDLTEIQTMMLAFLSAVNEETILNGKYIGDEEERVLEAARILKSSPLYVEELPDFSLQDVENTIKKSIREHGCKYIFHDYIHTSMKILEEVTRRSGGVKLREDNVLFMLSIKLKDICNQYGVFIMSATQLNGDYGEADTPDQNLLRGIAMCH